MTLGSKISLGTKTLILGTLGLRQLMNHKLKREDIYDIYLEVKFDSKMTSVF